MCKSLDRTVRIGITLAACNVALLLIGCAAGVSSGTATAPAEVWIKEENNGQRVQVNVGQTLGVDLESNPGTGYSWEVATVNPQILQQVGDPEFKSEATPNRVGAPGRQLIRFKIKGKGESNLELHYVRPWEKDQPPAKTFTVTVVVQ